VSLNISDIYRQYQVKPSGNKSTKAGRVNNGGSIGGGGPHHRAISMLDQHQMQPPELLQNFGLTGVSATSNNKFAPTSNHLMNIQNFNDMDISTIQRI